MLSRGLQKGVKWTGWYHATVNLGDTGAIARRPEEFTQGSPREIGGRAIKAVMRQDAEAAIALAKEALQMDPLEVGLCLGQRPSPPSHSTIDAAQGDHYLNLGHAYRTAGKGGEAMAAFEHAVRLLPRNPGVYLTLGQ